MTTVLQAALNLMSKSCPLPGITEDTQGQGLGLRLLGGPIRACLVLCTLEAQDREREGRTQPQLLSYSGQWEQPGSPQ